MHFAPVSYHAILFLLLGIVTFYPVSIKICRQIQLILLLIQEGMALEKWDTINTYHECYDLIQALLLKIKLKQLKKAKYPTLLKLGRKKSNY